MRVTLLLVAVIALFAQADRPRMQRDVRTKHFSTALVCKSCHSNSADSGAMRDIQGRGIAPHDLWQSTSMANSARDPFFRALLAAESKVHGAKVEKGCLHCHAPMASYEAGEKGLAFAQLDDEFEEKDWDVAALARDGVSCTLCHQLTPEQGSNGDFRINEDREIYGRFDKQFGVAMHRVSQYWPVQGMHVLDADQCRSCHASSVAGEQTWYEWRNSKADRTCQDCHMPSDPTRTRIARASHPGDIPNIIPRTPISKHTFVGGNTLLLRILRDNIHDLKVKAPRAAFDRTIAETRRMLQTMTARVSIEDARPTTGALRVVVQVENLAGHKFPSGHASRRAWLRLRLREGKTPGGRILFAVGEHDARGRLLGAKGLHPAERPGAAFLPHFTTVRNADEVQIYQSVMKGSSIFVHASKGLVKDNRLLPDGWKADHADAAKTRPIGIGED
ncbi:MAG: hypothetical protein AAGD14_19190, partial [Planctomycetota bacterium]